MSDLATDAVLERVEPLLRSEDLDHVRQGVELLAAAEIDDGIAELVSGTRLSAGGSLLVGPWVVRHAVEAHRMWLALALLRAAGRLDGLETIHLEWNTTLTDLSPLTDLPRLERLILRGCRELTLADVPVLPALRALDMSGCGQRAWPAEGLGAGWPRLERLKLRSCDGLERLRLTGGLASLRQLDLSTCDHLTRATIADLPSLRQLTVRSCRALTHLEISGAPALERLDVSGCEELVELTSTVRPAEVDLRGCEKLERAGGIGE